MPDWLAEHDALTAADHEGGLTAEDLERLAVAAFLVGHEDEVATLRERAFDQYLAAGMVDEAVRCGCWLGFHLSTTGEAAQARGWAAKLGRLVADDPQGRNAGFLLQAEGAGRMFGGDAEGAMALFDRSTVIARSWSDNDVLALAGMGRGRCLTMLGRYEEAEAATDEVMVDVVSGRVQPHVAGLVYCIVISLCMARMDVPRAHEWTQALASWVDEQEGLVPYRGTCLVHQAEILQWRGDWAAAAIQSDVALARLQASGEGALAEAHYCAAELARLQGRLEDAEAGYELAAARGFEVQPGLARLRLAQGRADVAVAGLRRALGEEFIALPPRSALLGAMVEAALVTNDLNLARSASIELTALVDAAAPIALRAQAAHWCGAVLLTEGDTAAALPILRSALAGWRDVDAAYDAARTRVLLARACNDLGDHDAAASERSAARVAFAQMGARADLTALDTESTPSPAGPLSPRELEVLRLLATGAPNKAIAERLVLSEKTVARHLSNIYTKLGVGTRAGATAYAFEHHLV